MDVPRTFSVDDIWTPDKPLPSARVLKAIADRCALYWEMPALTGQVRICYNPRLRSTLGRALLVDKRVELNTNLLITHPHELVPTLAHELAHVAVHSRYGHVRPHGRHFTVLMRAVNLSAGATHSLPVGHLKRKRRKFLYLHVCSDCGYSFIARSVRRNCYCIACGPEMTWSLLRAPNCKEGLAKLAGLTKELAAAGRPSRSGSARL